MRRKRKPGGIALGVVGAWPAVSDRSAGYDLVIHATGNVSVHELLSASPQLRDAALAWCYVKLGPGFSILDLRLTGSPSYLAEAEELSEECREELREVIQGETNSHCV